MDVRLNEIARNAERLYNDAKLLCAMQRFPSAMALAVLAVEEAGKFVIERGKTAVPNQRRLNRSPHKDKQAVLGNIYLSMMAYTALLDYFNKIRDWALATGHPTYMDIKDLEDNVAVEWTRHAVNSRDPEGAYKMVMATREKWEPLASFLEQACDGIHDREKQKGFYVDVTDDAILSSPFDIGEADANRWLNHAEVAVSMMSGMMRAGDNDS
jgi:AbiV family abortive infection protein